MITEQGQPYGYRVETLGAANARELLLSHLSDGARSCGAAQCSIELDVRALRSDLMSSAMNPLVTNRQGGIATTVIATVAALRRA